MQSAQLKDVRAESERVQEFSASAEQRTVKRADRSFAAFFRRSQNGETPDYPRFKSWKRFDTVDHTAGDGSKWVPTEGRWAHAYFQGVGHIKVSEHTKVTGEVNQLSLVRDGRKWYVIAVATSEIECLPETGRSVGIDVGIDVGINRFLTTSDGEIVDNPRFGKERADELADLQRRYEAGNRRSKTLRRKIRTLHRQTKNRRLNFHHQVARRLVNQCDVIGLEGLAVDNMIKRAKAKPDPDNPGAFLPNGAAAKTGLNTSIADVGWAQFRTILTAKAENAGRVVVAVNPAYTSIDCCRRGARCTRPETPTVVCPVCGPIDADLNGAINTALRAGLGSPEGFVVFGERHAA